MKVLRNLLALIGLLAIVASAYGLWKVEPYLQAARGLDEQAVDTYLNMGKVLLETGDIAEATVWKIPVEEDLSPEDVEEVMKFVANEHNIKNVGELPLSAEISAQRGEDYRFLKIFMFCNPATAANMVDYSDAFSAYLPCRISLVEDTSGKLWLYSLNMDLMINGGKALPEALFDEATQVKEVMLDIMNRGATGEF